MGVQQPGLMFRGRFFPAAPPTIQPCSVCYADTDRLVPCDVTKNGVGLCRGHWGEYERDEAERMARTGVA